MKITSKGYIPKFIQTHPVRDDTRHLKTYVYKFFSPETKLQYVLTAEYYDYDFFAIKFYAKKDRRSDSKYSKVINKGDVANILVTCANLVPILLADFPNASFGFIGSRTIDVYAAKVEGYSDNQRFRLYCYHIPQLIGHKNFEHRSYTNVSAYMLLNKKNESTKDLEKSIRVMIINTYPNILNITST
ncbi:hypothetical protein DHD32_01120 [Arenibacter sp. TNZ]|uniref:hypothetical protein n=1 Tax=Arenibacter TaxID=178469 RepID=UPI000CD46D36|nr:MULTISPECIES: hypothetical protein [Arenibacter]MCM4170064.1 hypothetical protein [Arenibacter sp. TNZ]